MKKIDSDITNKSTDKPLNISIVDLPVIQPSLPNTSPDTTNKDYTIEKKINEMFFFYILVTASENIISLEKSLRLDLTHSELQPSSGNGFSSTSSSNTDGRKNLSLQQKILKIVYKAFWDKILF